MPTNYLDYEIHGLELSIARQEKDNTNIHNLELDKSRLLGFEMSKRFAEEKLQRLVKEGGDILDIAIDFFGTELLRDRKYEAESYAEGAQKGCECCYNLLLELKREGGSDIYADTEITFDSCLPVLKMPEYNRPVKAILKLFNKFKTMDEVLIRVKDDDCDWRTADDNSEIANNWDVIYWEYLNTKGDENDR